MSRRRGSSWRKTLGGLWLPSPYLSIGYPCCCPEVDYHCTISCSGTRPNQYEVTIAYVADGSWGVYQCTNCDETFNDTFVLDFVDPGSGEACYWQYNGTWQCPYDSETWDFTVTLWFYSTDGPVYYMRVDLYSDICGPLAAWRKDFGADKPGCIQTNQTPGLIISTSTCCDTSGATCQVNAV